VSPRFRNWRAHLLMRRKSSAVQEHCPPEKLLAIRYSLPFWLGRSLALPYRLKSVTLTGLYNGGGAL
jgi:hypothetical protein